MEKTNIKHNGLRTNVSGTLGTALEFYDYSLYGLAAGTVFKRVFFDSTSPQTALIASLATFTVGYLARPLGGLVLGAIGDRVGRKQIMVSTILLMGTASTLIGVLPTYDSVGILAPILLVLLRVIQGIGAGAEMSSSSTLMSESANPQNRGLIGSLVGIGTNGGTLLASLAWFSVSRLQEPRLLSWGWRIPFILSIVIAAIGLWMRRGVDESATFTKVESKNADLTVVQNYRMILNNSLTRILECIGMRWGENGISTVFLVFLVGELGTIAPDQKGLGSLAVFLSAIVGLGTVPLFGWLSDRFGRNPVYMFLSIFQFVASLPAIWMVRTGNTAWVVLAFILSYSIGVMGMYAVQSAYMVELFGSRTRLAAVTASKEIGAVTSGGLAPLISASLISIGGLWAVGAYMLVLSTVSVVSTACLPETRGRDLGLEEDAPKAHAAPRRRHQ